MTIARFTITMLSIFPDQTPPFLIRAFVKIGGFHRVTLFEDNALPTTDEFQIFSWFVSFLIDLYDSSYVSVVLGKMRLFLKS